jgi:hypothetical protein
MKDKLNDSKNKVFNDAIATKILDLLDDLIKSDNESNKRRWIWELIQNAKDVQYDNKPVAISINLLKNENQTFLEFKHNGKPFTIDNITYLIEQVSTKERKQKEGQILKNTGKFGTGFLTTHLLSKKVSIKSVVSEENLEPRKFAIELDRTGKTKEEIINSVNNSIKILEKLDDYEIYKSFNPSEFNTEFSYILDNNGLIVAEKGINDFHLSIPFTLLFLPEIEKITIENANITYKVLNRDILINEDYQIYTAKILKNNSEIEIAYIKENKITVAVLIGHVENKIVIKPFDNQQPKLFCDFPLIGTEEFNIPFVINSSLFNPTKNRDGIDLTDIENEDINQNKLILQKSVIMFSKLLDWASNNCNEVYNLANVSNAKEKSWLSYKFYEQSVLNPIKNKILNTKIVLLENGNKASIKDTEGKANIYFPYSTDDIVRERIWELEYKMFPDRLPTKEHLHKWYEIITKWSSNDCFKDGLNAIIKFIHEKENVEKLSSYLKNDIIATINWLNEFYDLLNFEKRAIEEIISDKFAIIPNQKNQFKKRAELKLGKGIDEEIKNIAEFLDIDIRSILRNDLVITASKYTNEKEGQILYTVKEQSDLISEINEILRNGKHNNSAKAISYIISCFSAEDNFPQERERIYSYCKQLLKDEIPEKREIKNLDLKLWEVADILRIGRLIKEVSDKNDTQTLSNFLKIENSIEWLVSFISFLSSNQKFKEKLNLQSSPILPNQNGFFKPKDELFIENDLIDNKLKEILCELGYNIKDELLSIEFNQIVDIPHNRVRTAKFVSDEIKNKIYSLSLEQKKEQQIRKIFNSLLIWFKDFPQQSKILFGDLYDNKHILYDDNEIASNCQKAEIIDDLLISFNIETPNELKHNIIELKENYETANQKANKYDRILNLFDLKDYDKLIEVLNNGLIITGIKEINPDDFETEEEFLTEKERRKEYAKGLLKRANYNVRKKLENLNGQYDLSKSFMLPDVETVIKNVIKNDKTISIVIRPSDNDEIRFFYPEEKRELQYSDTELWIDNGDIQEQLTLGELLKRTGIERFQFINNE